MAKIRNEAWYKHRVSVLEAAIKVLMRGLEQDLMFTYYTNRKHAKEMCGVTNLLTKKVWVVLRDQNNKEFPGGKPPSRYWVTHKKVADKLKMKKGYSIV